MGNRIDIAILGFLVFCLLFTLTFVNPFQLQCQIQPKTRQKTRNPGDEIEPQWSPDDRIIFYGAVRDSSQNVGVIDIPTGQENLWTEDLKLLHATCWSPDGNQIAYSTGTQEKRGFIFHIHTISLVDDKIQALTSGPYIDGIRVGLSMANTTLFNPTEAGIWISGSRI